ncbi:ERO1 domain containing protein, partial [Asbolus verrucosus]
YSFGYFGNIRDEDDCFCQLQGKIDDCTCNVDTVDHFNNVKVYPRLRSLLQKAYFRFYKVNLRRENIVLWSAYDDAQDNFCVLEDNDSESEYVDLLLNPERYTGYKGTSAHRIWHSIYMENCFRSTKIDNPYIQSSKLNNMCLEERVFYRAISGLHSSINIHLCAQYLLSESTLTEPNGKWGHNLIEFQHKFAKENTRGEGPHWLRNLYFVYLLELRALSKAFPYLDKEEFYTGNDTEDWDTKLAVKDLLNIVKQFPDHFNESSMFAGSEQAEKLKYEFKQHFRNVSKIMDCIQGLGTALKILFSEKFESDKLEHPSPNKKNFQLQRSEIVSLVNSIG